MAQQIVINPVTRIEGHAKIVLDLDDQGQVVNGHLQVMEIRGFEKLLEGMELFKMPQITARLCGVCPAAHTLAAVAAIETGLGISPPREAALLRELLYVGHMLHSHALSCFVLAGPDLLLGIGADPKSRNIFELLRLEPEIAKKMLRLRSIGQRTVEIVGGRGIHPVTVIAGGMSSRPDKQELDTISSWGSEALDLIAEIAVPLHERLAGMEEIRSGMPLDFPALALSEDGGHSYLHGDFVVTSSTGKKQRIPVADYDKYLVEHVMPGSYMKSVRLRGEPEQSYYVGPLARLLVNGMISTPKAYEALEAFREKRCTQPSALDYIEARLVEMIHTAERMTEIAGSELSGGPLRTPAEPGEGRYVGAVEAPRGILIHDYTTDKEGKVLKANLIVATQNNYDVMDASITNLARNLLKTGDNNLLMNGMEFALRCFDPCLSCATHVYGRMPMDISLRHNGSEIRKITRRSDS